MNIRDERTVVEQVKSGFRLAGWVLVTLAFVFALFWGATAVAGRGSFTQPIHRALGLCVLIAASAVMLVSVRYWTKWFIGAMAYWVLRVALSLVLGFTPSVPAVIRPRLVFLELLVLLVAALALCFRYLTRKPRPVERVGLVCLVFALTFSVVYDSNVPLLGGVMLLGVAQLAERINQRDSARVARSSKSF